MSFVHPLYLFLLLVLLPLIAWYIWKQRKITTEITFSTTAAFTHYKPSLKVYLRHLPFALRILTIALVIFTLARPQASESWQDETTEGIDIILAIDISSSMLAEDLEPNRLEAAKEVATDFITDRPTDNIGLVVFAGESFMPCPLTINHNELINLLLGVESGMIEDGTAIGSGLATSINHIKDSEAKSKVVILLTDGSNNKGQIAPVTAGEIAKTFGIRVYTIGVGTTGTAPYPFSTPLGTRYQNIPVDIDEGTLQQIANSTDGAYFRATNTENLKEIYKEIDKMEKTKINVREFSQKDELFFLFALVAALLLTAEIVLRNTIYKSIP